MMTTNLSTDVFILKNLLKPLNWGFETFKILLSLCRKKIPKIDAKKKKKENHLINFLSEAWSYAWPISSKINNLFSLIKYNIGHHFLF